MTSEQRSGSGSGSGRTGLKSPAERSPVQVGDLVADKYRVEEIIAAGGMGVIVAARHEELGQRFAIKFLVTESDAELEMSAARFLREARAAASIDSAHVCRVFDCGALTDGGTPYMVMEHLSGHDLSHEIKSRGKLGVNESVDFVLQALEGIAEAHAAGIIHRDLKPSNLFLCQKAGREPEVKVLDFGISKVTSVGQNADEDLTASAIMLGSPRYMSPEQVRNTKEVDARTDIWSLGVILYQMLDGHSPFRGTTMGETISRVLTHIPPPVRRARGDVPEALEQVIDRCLQRDRSLRYANVGELALALAPFATAESHASVRRITALLNDGLLGGPSHVDEPTQVAGPQAAAAAQGPKDEPSIGTQRAFSQNAEPKPRRFKLALGLVAALASVLVIAFFALRHGRPSAAAPIASAAAVPSAAAATAAQAPSASPAQSEPAPSAHAAASAAPAASASAAAAPTASASAAPGAKSIPKHSRVRATHRLVHHKAAGSDTDILGESY